MNKAIFVLLSTIFIISLNTFAQASDSEVGGDSAGRQADNDKKKQEEKKKPNINTAKRNKDGHAARLAAALNSLDVKDVKALQEGLANYDASATNISRTPNFTFSPESIDHVRSIADAISKSISP